MLADGDPEQIDQIMVVYITDSQTSDKQTFDYKPK